MSKFIYDVDTTELVPGKLYQFKMSFSLNFYKENGIDLENHIPDCVEDLEKGEILLFIGEGEKIKETFNWSEHTPYFFLRRKQKISWRIHVEPHEKISEKIRGYFSLCVNCVE